LSKKRKKKASPPPRGDSLRERAPDISERVATPRERDVAVREHAAAAPESASAPRKLPIREIWLMGVLAVSGLVYTRSIHSQFVYDDLADIVGNKYIKLWSFIWKSFYKELWWFSDPDRAASLYYRPLQNLWLGVNFHLFHYDPRGYHVLMIVMQVVVVYLLFRVTEELTHRLSSAIIAAMLFGLMPVHTQAVAWPSAIPMPMALAFQLGAFLLVIRRGTARIRNSAPAVGLFFCALLTHESAIVFPVVVAAYAFLGLEREVQQRLSWQSRVRASANACAPFFAAAFVYLGIRFAVLGYINAVAATNEMTLYVALISTPQIFFKYLLMLALPIQAEPAHSVATISSIWSPAFYLPMILLIVIAAAVAALLVNYRRQAPIYFFCIVWILLAIAPVLNLRAFRVISLMEDRYVYAASAPWSIMVGAFAGQLIAASSLLAWLTIPALTAAGIALGVILWRVQYFWQSDLVMFSRCVADEPGSWLCQEWLSASLMDEGEVQKAEKDIKIAIALNPAPGSDMMRLGQMYITEGEQKRGLAEMVSAMQAKGVENKWYFEVVTDAIAMQDYDTAEKLLKMIAAKPKGGAIAAIGYAQIKQSHHDYVGARDILKDATKQYPEDPDLWILLAQNDEVLHDYLNALIAADHAIDLSPNAAWYRMLRGKLLDKLGRHDEAVAEYRRAIEVAPEDDNIPIVVAKVAPEALR
jgi:predicted negative regulator of RcsB-dependent stress response